MEAPSDCDNCDLTSTVAGGELRLQCQTITALDALYRLAEDWRSLEKTAQGALFFQSYDWCRTVLQALLGPAPNSVVNGGVDGVVDGAVLPRVLIARRNGRAVLIWPLAIRITAGQRIVQDLTEPFGQYSDALLDPDEDAETVLNAAWTEISRWRPDALLLRRVRADAAIAPWLRRHASGIGVIDQAPAVDLSAFPDFPAYRKSLSAKTRKNLRNCRNRLSRQGTLVHRSVEEPESRRDLLMRCFSYRTQWLASSGLSSTAFRHRAFEPLIRRLADGHVGAPPIVMFHLSLYDSSATGEQTSCDVALQWGFEHAGRYYAFMSARNPEFDAFSPGRLHLEDVVQTCAARGIAVADLLAPDMPYKSSVATSSVAVTGFGLPATFRGTMFIRGWHGLVRPAIKNVVLKIPKAARAAIVNRIAPWIRPLLPATTARTPPRAGAAS